MKNFILILFIFSIVFVSKAQMLFVADSTEKNYDLLSKITLENRILENEKFTTEFLNNFKEDFNLEKQFQNLTTKNVDEWEMDLFEKKIAQQKFLKEHSALLKDYQVKRVENEINYHYWLLIYAFPIIKSNADTKLKNVVSLPKIMTNSFKIDTQNKDSLFECKSYRLLLPYWVTYHNSENHKFVKYSDMVQSTVDKTEFAIQNLKGNALDYTLANILNTNKDRISGSAARYVISQIENQKVQNQFNGTFLEALLAKDAIAKKEKDAAEHKKKNKEQGEITALDGSTFSFSKFSGKVLYVDFWASWCGPCRGQMPFSKQMHESLSDKEKNKVIFLYISIDDNEETWKSALEKLGLKEFENGISKGGWNSEITKKYKISSIPRYMIIDKKGNIVKDNAGRPSDPETILELKELMK